MPKETPELPVSEQEVQIQSPSFLDKINPPAGGHKLKILGIILGFLVFTGAVFGAYRLGTRNVQLYPQPTPTPVVVATPTPGPTAHWKTYTNPRFLIKFPPEMEDFRCDQSSCWSMSTSLPTGARIAFMEGGPSTLFSNISWENIIEELREKKISWSEREISGKEGIYIKTTENITPLGTPFDDAYKEGVVIHLERNGWLSFFMYKYEFDEEKVKVKNLVPSEEELSIFNLMLSTFKFLE